MFKVIKKMEFCYGHRLMAHSGPCKHLHGHNARVELELAAENLNPQGMVRDFLEIKQVMQTWLDRTFDHRMLLQEGDPLIDVLKKADEPVGVVGYPPTAENLAREIFSYAQTAGLPIKEVRIWETQNSLASYCGDKNNHKDSD